MRSGNSCAALMFAALWAAGCVDEPREAEVDLLVRSVTVVSPELDTPLTGAWVAISGGLIARTGTGTPPMAGRATLEGDGRFLTPGLIDSHVHLAAVPGMNYPPPAALRAIVDAYAEQLPRSYLYFGYTTLIDLAVMDRAFLDIFESRPLHPDLFDCDGPLVIANGYPMAFLPPETRFDHFPNFLYDARQADAIPERFPAEAHTPAAAVQRVAAHGGICVKTHWETGFGPLRGLPTPSEEMIAAIMESAGSATEAGLVVTMHANSLDGHRFAANAGVDVIVHGLWNAPAGHDGALHDDVYAVLDATLEKNIGYMPTMQVLGGMGLMFDPAFLDDPNLAAVLPAALIRWYRTPEGRWFADELRLEFEGMEDTQILAQYDSAFGPLATSQKTVAYLAERNGRLLFGSDTPSSPTFGNPPGYNGYLEMQNLVEAGVSLQKLLAMATIDNAEAFGLDDRYGTVESGKVANLLLLDKDPLQTVDAWNSISTVILHGTPIERQSLAAQSRQTPAPQAE